MTLDTESVFDYCFRLYKMSSTRMRFEALVIFDLFQLKIADENISVSTRIQKHPLYAEMLNMSKKRGQYFTVKKV